MELDAQDVIAALEAQRNEALTKAAHAMAMVAK